MNTNVFFLMVILMVFNCHANDLAIKQQAKIDNIVVEDICDDINETLEKMGAVLAGIHSAVEMRTETSTLHGLAVQLDQSVWDLSRLECPTDLDRAKQLSTQVRQAFESELFNEQLARIQNHDFFASPLFSQSPYSEGSFRACGGPMMFEDVAKALAQASPEEKSNFKKNVSIARELQNLECSLRVLVYTSEESLLDEIERLGSHILQISKSYKQETPVRDTALAKYQRFLFSSSLNNLLDQYILVRESRLMENDKIREATLPLEHLLIKDLEEDKYVSLDYVKDRYKVLVKRGKGIVK